jgi:hypothetical protein
MRRVMAVVGAGALVLGGCRPYQKIELVNSTARAVCVSVATPSEWRDAEPRADVARRAGGTATCRRAGRGA